MCNNCMNNSNIYKWYEKEMIIMYHHNYYSMSILFNREIDWSIIRLIWIAFYKNESNKDCFISKLPIDLIKYIIIFYGTNDENILSKCEWIEKKSSKASIISKRKENKNALFV